MGGQVMIVGTRLRSVVMIAVMTSFALAFYMISLKVSAERSAVERLERRIASSMMSIRQLQPELGTRERLPPIEQWNDEVLALLAPKAGYPTSTGSGTHGSGRGHLGGRRYSKIK